MKGYTRRRIRLLTAEGPGLEYEEYAGTAHELVQRGKAEYVDADSNASGDPQPRAAAGKRRRRKAPRTST